MSKYTVNADWDDETKSWWTDGEDIPGLCCQADSFEELIEAILAFAPELLRDNGTEPLGQPIDIKIVVEPHAARVSPPDGAVARGRLSVRTPRQGKPRDLVQPDQQSTFTLPSNIRNPLLANAILRQAGLPKAF